MSGEGLPRNLDRAETHLRAPPSRAICARCSRSPNSTAAATAARPICARPKSGTAARRARRRAGAIHRRPSRRDRRRRSEPAGRGALVPKAAEQGHPVAAHNIASFYAKGTASSAIREARRWFHFAAEKDVVASQVQLARMMSRWRRRPRDLRAARSWLDARVRQGDAEAKALLGSLYLTGEHGERDAGKAELLLQRSRRSRAFRPPRRNSAISTPAATTSPPRPEDALRWYRIAAEAGQSEAQFLLALMLRQGVGAPADAAEAAQWFARAAQLGHAGAQFELGVMYCTGEGVPRDLAAGARCYAAAAQSGHPEGMHIWGVMLLQGMGVEKDEETGLAWLSRAGVATPA